MNECSIYGCQKYKMKYENDNKEGRREETNDGL